jgi:response regulator RpfG family c-di-GMP phosphodiesterase
MHKDMKIVLVDDEEINLILLEELTSSIGFKDIIMFLDPLSALSHLEKNHCDILVLDYNMPKMDGLTLLKKAKEIDSTMISIMITASNEESVMIDALKIGVTDFLTKPISSIAYTLRLQNMAKIQNSHRLTKEFNTILQKQVDSVTASLQESEFETLQVLSKAAEYKDPETASHIARVAHYTKMLARKIGLSKQEQEILFYAAPLHDLGKIGIEDEILLKPGKLESEEFDRMKEHSAIGATILTSTKNIYLKAGKEIAHSHHEKYDGSGYPQGLKGEMIPLYGRIVAIADVFDALTSERPYKKAWSFERAMGFLIEESGSHFDPSLVSIFIDNEFEVRAIYEEFE